MKRGLKKFGSFEYPGSVVSESGGTEEGVASRIKKTNCVFVQLYPVWEKSQHIRKFKIRIFNKNVKSVLLQFCETWGNCHPDSKQTTDIFK